jgi:hypothetical protein
LVQGGQVTKAMIVQFGFWSTLNLTEEDDGASLISLYSPEIGAHEWCRTLEITTKLPGQFQPTAKSAIQNQRKKIVKKLWCNRISTVKKQNEEKKQKINK